MWWDERTVHSVCIVYDNVDYHLLYTGVSYTEDVH